MVGVKGRSGRKPATDGKTMRHVAFYIPMSESEDYNGRKYWIPEVWFRQFKRIYGSKWQAITRSLIQQKVKDDQTERMWQCECNHALLKHHFRTHPHCNHCGMWMNEAARRIHDHNYKPINDFKPKEKNDAF